MPATAYTRIRHSSTATANQDPSLTLSFDLLANTDYAIDIFVRLNSTTGHSGVKFTAVLGSDQSVFSIPHNGVTEASIYTLNVTDLTADSTLTIKLDNDGGAINNGFRAIRIPAVGVAATSAEVPLKLTDFSYDPSTGDSQASIEGGAETAYILVEADDLDFSNPDQSPVALAGATVGTLDGNTVITDVNGDATVQFNLGTSKTATFVRAETAPPPPPIFSMNFP